MYIEQMPMAENNFDLLEPSWLPSSFMIGRNWMEHFCPLVARSLIGCLNQLGQYQEYQYSECPFGGF